MLISRETNISKAYALKILQMERNFPLRHCRLGTHWGVPLLKAALGILVGIKLNMTAQCTLAPEVNRSDWQGMVVEDCSMRGGNLWDEGSREVGKGTNLTVTESESWISKSGSGWGLKAVISLRSVITQQIHHDEAGPGSIQKASQWFRITGRTKVVHAWEQIWLLCRWSVAQVGTKHETLTWKAIPQGRRGRSLLLSPRQPLAAVLSQSWT